MLALVSFICFAPSAFGVTFAKSAGESTKRATAHDYDDRNIPDVFDIVYYDTHGRDGLTLYTTCANAHYKNRHLFTYTSGLNRCTLEPLPTDGELLASGARLSGKERYVTTHIS